jgi:hypothetical protein
MLTVQDPLFPAARGKCVVISSRAGCLEVVALQILSVETATLRENCWIGKPDDARGENSYTARQSGGDSRVELVDSRTLSRGVSTLLFMYIQIYNYHAVVKLKWSVKLVFQLVSFGETEDWPKIWTNITIGGRWGYSTARSNVISYLCQVHGSGRGEIRIPPFFLHITKPNLMTVISLPH